MGGVKDVVAKRWVLLRGLIDMKRLEQNTIYFEPPGKTLNPKP